MSPPRRGCPVVLALMVNDTRPLPVALDGEVIVIQVSLLDATHAHPAAVVTSTNDDDCAFGAVMLVGATA